MIIDNLFSPLNPYKIQIYSIYLSGKENTIHIYIGFKQRRKINALLTKINLPLLIFSRPQIIRFNRFEILSVHFADAGHQLGHVTVFT